MIISEGEKTEKNYFNSLKKDLPPGILQTYQIDVEGTGLNTESLIAEARRIQNIATENGRPYDEIWAVFDKDSFEHFNDAINSATDGKPKIECAWSNESFELWYILHFVEFEARIGRGAYITILEEQISKATNKKEYKYKKNSQEIYNILKVHGNVYLALDRGRKLHVRCNGKDYANHNPTTLVYLLVEKLMKLHPDFEKMKIAKRQSGKSLKK